MQVESSLRMDRVDPDSIKLLMDDGDKMWNENKEKV